MYKFTTRYNTVSFAAMVRRRNIIVRVERSKVLDELFKLKADKFFYDKGAYTLHFKNPTTIKAVQEWSGCKNVETLDRRKHTTDSIYHSVLEAQKEYEEMIAKGEMIDTVIKKHGISEEVLQPRHIRPLNLYRRKERKRLEEEAKHILEEEERLENNK